LDAGGIGEMVWTGGGILLAIAIGIGVLRLTTAGFHLAAPHDAAAVPLLHVSALAAGLGLGAALLLAVPHGEAFRLGRIFTLDSPWLVGLGGFLRLYALPGRETLAGLVAAMRDPEGLEGAAGWVAALLLAGGGFVALRWWQGRARLRAFVAFLMMAVLTALMLYYAVHLFAWLAAQLGFWIFLLLLLGFQRWRHAPRGAH
jgi:hypothetical protein